MKSELQTMNAVLRKRLQEFDKLMNFYAFCCRLFPYDFDKYVNNKMLVEYNIILQC